MPVSVGGGASPPYSGGTFQTVSKVDSESTDRPVADGAPCGRSAARRLRGAQPPRSRRAGPPPGRGRRRPTSRRAWPAWASCGCRTACPRGAAGREESWRACLKAGDSTRCRWTWRFRQAGMSPPSCACSWIGAPTCWRTTRRSPFDEEGREKSVGVRRDQPRCAATARLGALARERTLTAIDSMGAVGFQSSKVGDGDVAIVQVVAPQRQIDPRQTSSCRDSQPRSSRPQVFYGTDEA